MLLGLWAYGASLQTGSAAEYGFAPVSGQMSSPFGWRTDPMTGSQRFHGGIDLAASAGMPVYAPQAGIVMFSGTYGGYGKVVVLNHGNSLFTLYGHNSRLLVKPGDSVQRGQVISQVGSTGRSTGPHLHFEVHYNGQYVNPVTYLSYLQPGGNNTGVAQTPNTLPTRQAQVTSATNPADNQTQALTVRHVNRKHYANQAYGNKVVEVVTGGQVRQVKF